MWARDEYVNIEKYPEIKERNKDGLSSADPLDYVKNVIKRTNFGEIINHPPTYLSTDIIFPKYTDLKFPVIHTSLTSAGH